MIILNKYFFCEEPKPYIRVLLSSWGHGGRSFSRRHEGWGGKVARKVKAWTQFWQTEVLWFTFRVRLGTVCGRLLVSIWHDNGCYCELGIVLILSSGVKWWVII